jgi:hypothetical protein
MIAAQRRETPPSSVHCARTRVRKIGRAHERRMMKVDFDDYGWESGERPRLGVALIDNFDNVEK